MSIRARIAQADAGAEAAARAKALHDVEMELLGAFERHPSFYSPHHGKAVIEEELDELWDLIKADRGTSDEAREEAIQVAAMALRYVMDLCV